MKLSVIMPLYNQEKLFRIGLDSIPARDDIEIIVIDDGSTDNSLEEVRKYKEETGKNITILHNERNKGVAFSANRGLDIAKGEYVARLDSDGDYFVNLESGMEYLDGTDIVYHYLQSNDGDMWGVRADERAHCGGPVNFIRREFLGEDRYPRLENNSDRVLWEKLMTKNPTEIFLSPEVMFKHYNYPREGSLVWNVMHGITPRGLERND